MQPHAIIEEPAVVAGQAGQRSGMLELETLNLTCMAAGRSIISDVSVRVLPREILAVVGPSGAGKSSFLRLLNRLNEPTAGTVVVDGQDYRTIAPRELRRRIGMVMQRPYLFPGTVATNIDYGPRQIGSRVGNEQIAELLRLVGLPGYQERHVTTLSGGEAQRVSLARSLANHPDALLLDEPTSALDHVSARRIEDLILQINREQGLTCILVTHDRRQALRMAARTMLLSSGKLAAIGPSSEVLNATAPE